MLATLQAQHRALDALMAMLIRLTFDTPKPFLPSQSGWIWDAVLQGNKAIENAELSEKSPPMEST